MDEEELAAVVAHNEPALQLARKALAKECMVPLDWSAGATWVDQDYLDKCSEMRSVARAFAAETRQASMLGDSDTAIRCGIDNFRLGRVSANGGLNVDWLVGQAIGSIGRRILREQIEQCSEAQCQQIMEAVEKQEPYLESPSQVLQRERAYYRHAIGLMGAYTQLLMHRQLEQALELLNNAEQLYGIMRDLLRVHVAIRQFELAEERLPENLSDLVPQYLSRVPIDPYAKSELADRRQERRFVVAD